MLTPSALAYAEIVGVYPIIGLYTVPLALLTYAILGGSRLLVVGSDGAISVLSAATVASNSPSLCIFKSVVELSRMVTVAFRREIVV